MSSCRCHNLSFVKFTLFFSIYVGVAITTNPPNNNHTQSDTSPPNVVDETTVNSQTSDSDANVVGGVRSKSNSSVPLVVPIAAAVVLVVLIALAVVVAIFMLKLCLRLQKSEEMVGDEEEKDYVDIDEKLAPPVQVQDVVVM